MFDIVTSFADRYAALTTFSHKTEIQNPVKIHQLSRAEISLCGKALCRETTKPDCNGTLRP